MTTQINHVSKCCGYPLRTDCADEGTCCYVCSRCKKPTDPQTTTLTTSKTAEPLLSRLVEEAKHQIGASFLSSRGGAVDEAIEAAIRRTAQAVSDELTVHEMDMRGDDTEAVYRYRRGFNDARLRLEAKKKEIGL